MNTITPQEIDKFIADNHPNHSDHGWLLDGRKLWCECSWFLGSVELVVPGDAR